MTPISVVSSTSSALKPSTPRKYSAPIDGIHGAARRTASSRPAAVVPEPQRQRDDEPPRANRFAIQRMASALLLRTKSSSSAPTSGVNRISDSSGKSAALIIHSSDRRDCGPQPNAEYRYSSRTRTRRTHQQRVVLDETGLQPAEEEARSPAPRADKIHQHRPRCTCRSCARPTPTWVSAPGRSPRRPRHADRTPRVRARRPWSRQRRWRRRVRRRSTCSSAGGEAPRTSAPSRSDVSGLTT